MISFIDWCEKAKSRGNEIGAHGESHSLPARYADTNKRDEFQHKICQFLDIDGPIDDVFKKKYIEICREFPMIGEQILSGIPDWLTRLIDVTMIEGNLRKKMRIPPRIEVGYMINVKKKLSESEWKKVKEILPIFDTFHLAYIIDDMHPENRSVFSTFHDNDKEIGTDEISPHFYFKITNYLDVGAKTADIAVYLLATDERPKNDSETRTKALLYYRREDVGECRFPVPPDAAWNRFFRPVPPGDGPMCGRTCPKDPDIDKNILIRESENEIVHFNKALPSDQVNIILLGRTSIYAG